MLCGLKCEKRASLIIEVYRGALAGHYDENKMTIMLKEHYCWPSMSKDVQDLIKTYATCQVAKSHSLPEGFYTPLIVTEGPWTNVSMDFALDLLRTQRGKDLVFVVVNMFSNMAHFIACSKTNDATHIAELYFKEVMRLHGISEPIVSDRDTTFLSHFWIKLWKKLGTKLKFSTTFLPQTDGQTEVTNRTLGALLRELIKTHTKALDFLLPYVEFAYNKAPFNSIGMSLFKIVYRIEPLTSRDLALRALEGQPSVEAKRRVKQI